MESGTQTQMEMEMELKTESRGGKWAHAAFHIATTIATPAAYSPLPFALASLGWTTGLNLLTYNSLTHSLITITHMTIDTKKTQPHPHYRHPARCCWAPRCTFFYFFLVDLSLRVVLCRAYPVESNGLTVSQIQNQVTRSIVMISLRRHEHVGRTIGFLNRERCNNRKRS